MLIRHILGAYDHIYRANIVDFVKDMANYDLVICGDVIEHLEKDQGQEVLNELLGKCSYLILSIPLGHCHQVGFGENKYEDHLSTWEVADLNYLKIIESQKVGVGTILLVALIKGGQS